MEKQQERKSKKFLLFQFQVSEKPVTLLWMVRILINTFVEQELKVIFGKKKTLLRKRKLCTENRKQNDIQITTIDI